MVEVEAPVEIPVGMPSEGSGWAVLVRPSANRVYAAATPSLLRAEAAILDETVLGGRLGSLETRRIAGVDYLTFNGRLEEADLAQLGLLSGLYAVFRREGEALFPVAAVAPAHLDDDLLTIAKYAGKTNELFTRLLLNVTLWAGSDAAALGRPRRADERRLRVLDPLCGRGSTLHQALVYGCDADGCEIDPRDLDAHEAFLKTWLRRKRLKHTAEVVPLRHEGERLGRRFDVALAGDKQAWKEGRVQRMRAVQGDTTRAASFFRAASYDALVADAPYGVQHGSRSGGRLDRSPLDLLEQALPAWVPLLRPGAALGLSWNTQVAPRADALALLRGAGLEPVDHGPWRELAHRVDQAIHRDVVVARRVG